MRLLNGLMKIWKHLFKKDFKATNEMKPIDMSKYSYSTVTTQTTEPLGGWNEYFENYDLDKRSIPTTTLETTCLPPDEFKLNRELNQFIIIYYWKVKKSWKRSPKNYYVWISDDGIIELRKWGSPNGIESLVGNLYTLYQQYYGKESKSSKEKSR